MPGRIQPLPIAISAVLGLALATPSLITPAFAQNRTLDDCRSIASDAERLACYDEVTRADTSAGTSTATMEEPEDPVEEFGSEKVAEKKPEPAPQVTPEDDGGAMQNLLSLFGAESIANKSEEEELNSITMDVASFRLQPYGELIVILENGQVWRQIEPSRSITRLVDEDSVKTVVIERAALGSYRMKVMPMDRTMSVRRLR